jgi:hypothetical protein
MRKSLRIFVVVIPLLCFCSALAYQAPFVKSHIDWRIDALRATIKYALNPPEKTVFIPGGNPTPDLQFTIPVITETPSPSPSASPTGILLSKTPSVSPTNTLTPTPIPSQMTLTGIVHEYQAWNNCGPANLAMALSYWGWKGDQRDTAAFNKPDPRDKNVMPWELADFVTEKTNFKVMIRVGGDLQTLKSLIAAGFPVIIEKGFEGPKFDGWMGHYEVLNAYDDNKARFTAQDSYMGPNIAVSYDAAISNWRAFNYLYIVVYPTEHEGQVFSVVGPFADEAYSYQVAAQKALQESNKLSGRDRFFAWFNRGTNLVYLKDFAGAATAYDAAFANYSAIPEKERPWRMVWYQTGPYFAYFYTQRYQDVINLATTTLDAMNEPILEESYYWRGRAKLALKDVNGAIADFRSSLKYHPGFSPTLDQLQQLGVKP